MNDNLIETFLCLVNEGTLTAAAESLGLAQSTVTNRISALEEEVDSILFIRSPGYKRIQLTEKGNQFLQYANEWQQLSYKMHNWHSLQSKHYLNVGGLETYNSCIFRDFFSELIAGQDEACFALTIKTRVAEDLYSILRSRTIDIAFTVHNMVYPNIVVKPLFEEEYVVILNGDFPHSSPIDVHELDISKEIYVPWEHNFKLWHKDNIGDISKTLVSADILSNIISIAEHHESWLILPRTVAHMTPFFSKQRIYPLKYAPPARVCYMATNLTPVYDRIHGLNIFQNLLLKYIKKNEFIKLL